MFKFTFQITNNALGKVVDCEMELTVTNHKGEVLLRTVAAPELRCEQGESMTLEHSVRTGGGAAAQELSYTDFAYLNVQITLKKINYNDRTAVYEFNDTRVLHAADEVQLAAQYQAACTLAQEGAYEQAYAIFCTLGQYQSAPQMRELCYGKIYA